MGGKGSGGGWFHEAKMGPDGKTDNYFGPRGSSDHGHVVVTESGRVEYSRDAGERSGGGKGSGDSKGSGGGGK